MKTKLTLFIISFLFVSKTFAQSFEVPAGPFLDSLTYVAPPALLSKSTITITDYKQCNQSWSSSYLGTCTHTICQSGCAMTCAAMLLSANGVNVNPGQLNTYLTNNCGYADDYGNNCVNCNMRWTIPSPLYIGATMTWYGSAAYSLSTLKSEINAGNPVIVKVDHRYGGSGTCSHFVVVYGYNNSGTSSSDFLVYDPGTVTCPTGCNLSYYTICSEAYPLRIYHNVSTGSSCAITGITPTLNSPGSSSSPGTTISTTTPTLTWNAVSGASNYDVYISIYPYGSSNIIYQQTCVSGTSLSVPSGYLNSGGQYRWNIQANVGCGTCVSNNSSPLYFQVSSSCIGVTVGTQPTNQSATSGSTATFSVTASGSSPFTYQWYKNGSSISNATSYSYTTPTLSLSDNGNTYYCHITNCSGSSSINSSNATLSVTSGCSPVTVTNQPQDQAVTAGNTASFTVTVNGAAPYSYYWYKNGVFQSSTINSSSSNNTFTTSVLGTNDDGNYYFCTITNCSNSYSIQSNNADLAVTTGCTPVSINTQPSNQSVATGSTATFSVSTSGSSPFTYQWYKNGSSISNATNSSYTTPSLSLSDNGNTYYCHITNCSGSYFINSSSGILTVTSNCTGVSIFTQPTNQTSNVGNTATFTIVPNGTAPYTYQWYKNGNIINGANSSFYTTPVLSLSDNGSTYHCYLTNCNGANNYTSSDAILTVSNICYAVSISTNPANQTANVGSSAAFSVTPTGTAPFTFQWYKNGSILTGATNYYYNTPTLLPSDNGSNYYCRVSNCNGNYYINSSSATLAVTSACNNSEWIWAKSAGANATEMSYSIAVDDSENTYIAGCFLSQSITFGSTILVNDDNTGNTSDIFLVKYDLNGNVLWAKRSGGIGNEPWNNLSIAIDAFGNIYMAGSFDSPSINFDSFTLSNTTTLDPYADIFLVKYNTNGTVLWAKTAGGTNDDFITSVTVDDLGNAFLTGYYSSSSITFGTTTLTNSGAYDILIVKYYSNGSVAWAKKAGGTGNEQSTSIKLDSYGNYYITGYFTSSTLIFDTNTLTNAGSRDIFFTKYNSSGTVEWAKRIGGTGEEVANSVAIDSSNNIYICGYYTSISLNIGSSVLTNSGNYDILIAKYDISGNLIWAKSAGGTGSDKSTSIAVDASSNSYITGTYESSIVFGTTTLSSLSSSIFLVKFDVLGNPLWAKSIEGTAGSRTSKSISLDNSRNVYLTGYYSSNITFDNTTLTSSGNYDIFVAKYPAFLASTTSTNVTCNNGSNGTANAIVNIGGVSPFSYLWNTSPTQTSQTVTSLIAGNYIVTITDNLGAINTACVNITQPTPLSFSIAPAGFVTLCPGSSVVLHATPDFNSYLWSPNGETEDSIIVSTNGTYAVTVTDTNGCTASSLASTVSITPLPLAASAITGSVTVCKGQNSVLYTVPTITNATSYVWILPNGATGTSTTNSINVDYSTNAVSGYISVYGSNICGSGGSSNLYIAVVPTPTAFAGNDTTICNGDMIILSATGGNSYIWNNGVIQNIPFFPLSSNTYTVTVSNGFCTATDDVTISVIIPQTPVIYQVGNVLYSTITTGNQWYQDNVLVSNANSQSFSPPATGLYYSICTDGNGCHSDTSNVLYVTFTGVSSGFCNLKSLYIYPNPAINTINIDYPEFINNTTVQIFNIDGKILKEKILIQKKTQINISDLSSGVYILKVFNNEGILVKRLIKE